MSEISVNSITNSFPAKVVEQVVEPPIVKHKAKEIQFKEVKAESAKADRNIQFEEQIRQINLKLSGENKKIEYSVHERTNTLVFKIIDISTGDLIKEFPSEKLLDIAADVQERFGLIIDEKI